MNAVAHIVVIGAGIAGASLAWQLRGRGRVVVLEAEDSPSHHSTGRSAAMFTPYAGAPLIRAASLASRGFLRDPGLAFCTTPLTSPRGVLRLADDAQARELVDTFREAEGAGRPVRMLERKEAAALGPPLSPRVTCGLLDEEPRDIDVDALHSAFLRGAMAAGAELRLKSPVVNLSHTGHGWRVETPEETVSAPVVVNAAGAFADRIARLAGLNPLGLTPRKRTIAMFAAPDGVKARDRPLVTDAAFSFYLKPEATGVLLSPSDATPCDPGEVWPDDMDIAIAVDRMQQWLDLPVRRPRRSWSGLRSFFVDEDPVAGFDPEAEGFFWYAGQGGFGIQSSPALSRAAAAILSGEPVPEELRAVGLTAIALSPKRLRPKLEECAL